MWKLDKSYSIYTDREKDAPLVDREHQISIKGGALEVTGYVDGKKTPAKYKLEVTPSGKIKRFKQTNPANAGDTESGVYFVKGDMLLMRTHEFGKGSADWGFSGIRMSVTDAGGGTVPEGFQLNRGDRGATILEFQKVKGKK